MIKKLGLVVASVMLAMVGILNATETYAQENPGTAINVSVVPADTEAVISWSNPVASEGQCTYTDYQVWVEKVSDGERIGGNEVQSPWTATGLEPNTNYAVSIYTYSAECDEYSTIPAETTFTTTASDSNNAAMSDEKHTPKRVRNLTASKASGTSATLSWNAPRTKSGKHHSATEYAIDVIRKDGTDTRTIFDIDSTQATVTGLTNGVYRFRVSAYSKECNCWGKWRPVRYIHE